MSDPDGTIGKNGSEEPFQDIIISRNGRSFPMLGPAGAARELSFLPPAGDPLFAPVPDGLNHSQGRDPGLKASSTGGPEPERLQGQFSQPALPVLIGSGVGPALEELVNRLRQAHGPGFLLLVVDREEDILERNRLKERYRDFPGLRWIEGRSTEETLKSLSRFQEEHDFLPLRAIVNPLYLRLDREYYSSIREACEASARANFWERARYRKFSGNIPRVLLLTSSYFLIGEMVAACRRLGFEYHFLQVPEGEMAQGAFMEDLLAAVVGFRPDFALTINHLGVDREGVLAGLLEKLRLPLASWFVDNPHLILSLYTRVVNPWTAIFTWDADNLPSLRDLGFEHVFYLPLGTDATRFRPVPERFETRKRFPDIDSGWNGQVAFVGNSMVRKVDARKGRDTLPQELLDEYRQVAAGFADSDIRSIREYLLRDRPDLARHFDRLPSIEARLDYETMLTWEATLQYRLGCVRAILPFAPLIVGDSGWKDLLGQDQPWFYHRELGYYDDLPFFYACPSVNFNCTSKQMKGAVNQRVFDVPATRSFLLTDYREQVEELFEPGREIICYHSPEEAGELACRYLKDVKGRERVAGAAYRRVLAEHTYERRLTALAERMREVFG